MDAFTTEITALNTFILKELKSSLPLLNSLTQHLFNYPGKNIRARLMVTLAQFLGKSPLDDHFLRAAGIIELIHSGTLVHDDVIDENPTRRNQLTTHQVFGNTCSILLGDYLFTKAYLMAQDLPCKELFLPDLAATAHALVEGELLQLQQKNSSLSFEQYQEVIRLKTATLFSFACKSVAQLYAPEQQNNFQKIGYVFGELFQLIDDYLDYFGQEEVLGKPLGQDFKEQKITLPLLIHASRNPNTELNRFFEEYRSFTAAKDALAPYQSGCLTMIHHRLAECQTLLHELGAHDYVMPLLDAYLKTLHQRPEYIEH